MMDALQGGMAAGVLSAVVFWGVVLGIWAWWKLKTRRRVTEERWRAAVKAEHSMKRYIIFSGSEYDRCGGWGDFRMSGDDPDQLVSDLLDCDGWRCSEDYWYQVVDLTRGEVVKSGNLRELRQERCKHVNTYMVSPPSADQSDILVSGAYRVPGKYCQDCGAMLEVTPV